MLIFLTNCATHFNNVKKSAAKTRDVLTKNKYNLVKDSNKKNISQSSDIPKFSRIIYKPNRPKAITDKIISFSVNENIDLKNVLIELGRVVGIDVDIDPNIDGSVIMSAKNRPLEEILDRISNLGNIRYELKNNVLKFEKDSPYPIHYNVDYLLDGKLWNEVETNIKNIIKNLNNNNNTINRSSNIANNVNNNIASNNNSSSSISVNKIAGIMTIFANKRSHKNIKKYLAKVKKTSSIQVLIEAKVVEVRLTDNFATGIDWTFVGKSSTSLTPSLGQVSSTLNLSQSLLSGLSLAGSVEILKEFGDVRAISSPRISTLNNHTANLDFTENEKYFEVRVTQNFNGGGINNNVINSFTQVIPKDLDLGTQLTITPSVDIATNEINLKVQPTISIKSGTVIDPSTDSSGTKIGNKIPIVQTRTLETVAKVRDGQILVIGGLMSEDIQNITNGIPILEKIPLLGFFFRYSSEKKYIKETVIFIKASIIDNRSLERDDKIFFDNFVN